MQKSSAPAIRDLVLIGGGHTHSLVTKMFAMEPIPGARLTLISDVSYAPYSGMLPSQISGYYSYDESHIDLRRLAGFAGAQFILARVKGIDIEKKLVHFEEDRPPIEYDLAGLNIGITPSTGGIKGVEHAIRVKPVPQFLLRWEKIAASFEEHQDQVLTIVGGGAGGVELAFAARAKLGALARIRLFHRSAEIMPTHNSKVRQLITAELERQGVELLTSQPISEIKADGVLTQAGDFHHSDHTLVLTHASPASWLRETGLELDEKGFVKVNNYLQTLSHPDLFATGDIASQVGYSHPKSGVFAVRHAKPLFENLKRHFRGKSLKRYRPQKNFLGVIGTADGRGIGSRKFLASHSKAMWLLRDWIDRRFMNKFALLEAPDETVRAFAARPYDLERKKLEVKANTRCRGCAGKYPGKLLYEGLEETGSLSSGGFEDSAITHLEDGSTLVQSIDTLVDFLGDPYVFAQITLQHAGNDILSMGSTPQSMLLSVGLPFGQDRIIKRTLSQILMGAHVGAAQLGAKIVGGHTYFADELTISASLNGFLPKDHQAITKTSPRTGDHLILTKPLGSGTLFAAHMRFKAKGRWLDESIQQMLLSNKKASVLFREVGASALTDVSGYGFYGHLAEMFYKSGATPKLDGELPILKGSRECLEAGLKSSLHDSNRAYSQDFLSAELMLQADEAGFSPETSGPMLACVPADKSESLVASLKKAGYSMACVIGSVEES